MNRSDSSNHQRGDISPDGRHYWDGDVWQWQRLWLVADEIAEVVHNRLGRTAACVQFLAAGMLNQSWRVDTDNSSYVLRISRPERFQEQVAYEHEVLRQLKEQVSEVVVPLAGKDGEAIQHWNSHILTLFPFVEGVTGDAVDPDVRRPQVAAVLARLHRVSLDTIHMGQRPGFLSFDNAWRSIWREASTVLRRDIAKRGEFGALFEALEDDVARLEIWLNKHDVSHRSLAGTIIHGDFNARNLLFRDNRLVAVIDWDECHVDPIAWEVAQVGFGDPDIDPLAFWDIYLDAGGPLQHQHLKLMVNFARMGALMELRWTVKHGQVTPHVVDQLTDVTKALSRIGEIDAA